MLKKESLFQMEILVLRKEKLMKSYMIYTEHTCESNRIIFDGTISICVALIRVSIYFITFFLSN